MSLSVWHWNDDVVCLLINCTHNFSASGWMWGGAEMWSVLWWRAYSHSFVLLPCFRENEPPRFFSVCPHEDKVRSESYIHLRSFKHWYPLPVILEIFLYLSHSSLWHFSTSCQLKKTVKLRTWAQIKLFCSLPATLSTSRHPQPVCVCARSQTHCCSTLTEAEQCGAEQPTSPPHHPSKI